MNKINSFEIVKKLIFIVNREAKNGFSRKIWYNIERKLDDIPHDVYFTEKKGHATLLAKQAAESTNDPLIIIAVGGDGTIHEVLNGALQYSHITFGYIPTGSGNDFAKGFELPRNPEACLEIILREVNNISHQFDIGFYQGNDEQNGYFVNSLGAGFDASIVYKANKSPLKKWLNYFSLGNIIYAIYLIAELFHYKPNMLELTIDQKKYTFEKTWFITISNQPYYGGGMQIAPLADPKDGAFSIVVVHQLSRWKLLFVFMSVFSGKHLNFKEVTEYKGTDIKIDVDRPILLHADGENIGHTPIHVKMSARKWKLIQSSVAVSEGK
ncbi:diacylglycerol/lipid kinase family protein [Lederbergia lenta]|uniref:Sphingosine kinase n=1 Tax=Lederbergia lenta TaxID=1467 RepID=A0A2X4Z9X3_LEDLE|nr:diacylglycerol kinase family protein [Lederbergia lenta]MEC2326468.1 diacylglycerol kinase family lipid kinase [Lederbergia lenta]SQI61215.1 sphingosine kinase [Lederbergia lenta]